VEYLVEKVWGTPDPLIELPISDGLTYQVDPPEENRGTSNSLVYNELDIAINHLRHELRNTKLQDKVRNSIDKIIFTGGTPPPPTEEERQAIADMRPEPSDFLVYAENLHKESERIALQIAVNMQVDFIKKCTMFLTKLAAFDIEPTNELMLFLNLVPKDKEEAGHDPKGKEHIEQDVKGIDVLRLDRKLSRAVVALAGIAFDTPSGAMVDMGSMLLQLNVIESGDAENVAKEIVNKAMVAPDIALDAGALESLREQVHNVLLASNLVYRLSKRTFDIFSALERHVYIMDPPEPFAMDGDEEEDGPKFEPDKVPVQSVMNILNMLDPLRTTFRRNTAVRRLAREQSRSISRTMRPLLTEEFGPLPSAKELAAKGGGGGNQKDAALGLFVDESLDHFQRFGLQRVENDVVAPVLTMNYPSGGHLMSIDYVNVGPELLPLLATTEQPELARPFPDGLLLAMRDMTATGPFQRGGTLTLGTCEDVLDQLAAGSADITGCSNPMAASASLRRNTSHIISSLVDKRLPEVQVDPDLRVFSDGYINTRLNVESDVPRPAAPAVVTPFHITQQAPNGGIRDFATGKLIAPIKVYGSGLNGAEAMRGVEERAAPTFTMLWASQIRSYFVRLYGYACMGRLLYPVGHADNAEVIMTIIGIAQSGKSTLGRVAKNFFPNHLVAVLSSNIEPVFGLMCCLGMRLGVCFEMTKEFRLSRAEMQTAAGGEEMSIAVKHKDSVKVKWSVPLLFIGNELGPWEDASGSVQRRLFVFRFDTRIQDTKTNMDVQLENEMACVIILCFSALLVVLQRHVRTSFWKRDVVPHYFYLTSRELAHQSNRVVHMLDSKIFTFTHDLTHSTSLADVRTALEDMIREDENRKTLTATESTDANISSAAFALQLTVRDGEILGIVPTTFFQAHAWQAALAWLGPPSNLEDLVSDADAGDGVEWEHDEDEDNDTFETARDLVLREAALRAPKVLRDIEGGGLQLDAGEAKNEDIIEGNERMTVQTLLASASPQALAELDNELGGIPMILTQLFHPDRAVTSSVVKNIDDRNELVGMFREKKRQCVAQYVDAYSTDVSPSAEALALHQKQRETSNIVERLESTARLKPNLPLLPFQITGDPDHLGYACTDDIVACARQSQPWLEDVAPLCVAAF
jgi:hypothetical protein